MDYKNIQYNKNFLKEVIIRVDFASKLEAVTKAIPKNSNNKILKLFSIPETKKSVAFDDVNITLDGNSATTQVKKRIVTEHHFYGKHEDKMLLITPDFFAVTYKKYDVFENMRSDFLDVFKIMCALDPEISIKRIGLRYINIIELFENKPLDWSNYLNENMLSIFNMYDDKTKIARSFQVLDLNCEDYRIKYQFGMPNPDYPSPIVRKYYVLDIDAYYEGFLDNSNEVIKYIDKFHDEIQVLFERSIKDDLRRHMNDKG